MVTKSVKQPEVAQDMGASISNRDYVVYMDFPLQLTTTITTDRAVPFKQISGDSLSVFLIAVSAHVKYYATLTLVVCVVPV